MGGPPSFPQGFSCPVVLRILPAAFGLRVRGFHPLRPAFPKPFSCPSAHIMQSLPRNARIPVWALSVSLAATPEIDFSFSSSGYLDVSVPRVPPARLCIHRAVAEVCSAGFPHSEIGGSPDICSSPPLIAAYHVFHRLSVPRHPPCALCILTSILPGMHSVAFPGFLSFHDAFSDISFYVLFLDFLGCLTNHF